MRLLAGLTSVIYLTFVLFPPQAVASLHAINPAPSSGISSPPVPAEVTTRFVYAGDGGKVKRITGEGTTLYLGETFELAPDGTTTTYFFAGSQRIAALTTPPSTQQTAHSTPSTTQSLFAQWWRAVTTLVAWLTGQKAEAAPGPTLRFYHPDHLGSTNLITDEKGQVVELTEYTPFGTVSRHEAVEVASGHLVTGPLGHSATRHGFTGQRQDTGTGLILFPARAYDPDLGRFLQPDPFV